MGKLIISSVFVLGILLLFSFIGAITFPNTGIASGNLSVYGIDLLLMVVPVLSMSFIGYFLGKGIRGLKGGLEAMGLAYISTFIVGSVLALLTVSNFAYTAHLNFTWLGAGWYAPWVTMFLIGAPVMLAFLE
ncbi:MAG: hypothetical protein ACJ8DI_16935 [Ktedonobacteraceae bacterium]